MTRTADTIINGLNTLGYSIDDSASGISASEYIEISHDALDRPRKIRISNHEARPTYEALIGPKPPSTIS